MQPRWVKLCCAAAWALAAVPARGQIANVLERTRGSPVGLAIPGLSAAGAEEPTAVNVNPAGIGFVGDFTLQYFHESGRPSEFQGDGGYVAMPLGPFVPGLSMEWVRPETGGGPRYRKTTLALALAGGQSASFAVAWNWYSSPEPAHDDLFGIDFGLTLRPRRYLSIGAAALGLESRLAGRRLPVRYDLGGAVRFWRDTFTISSDLLANDASANAFRVTHLVVGLGAEFASGLGLLAQHQFPVDTGADRTPFERASATQLALVWNGEHVGVTGAGGGRSDGPGDWLAGFRVSAQRYRSMGALSRNVPFLDVADALERPISFLLPVGPKDPYGAFLRKLATIRDDRSVAALVLRIDDLPIGEARVEELRESIAAVKARKPVIAYLVGGSTKEYYLATAASQILAPPGTEVFVNGISTSTLFLKEGLGKLGIAFEAVAIGPYKNAPDPLTRSDMSEAQRRVTNTLLDDVYGRQVRAVADARGVPEQKVRELIDVGVFTAEQAKEAALVDDVVWPDEIETRLEAQLGRGLDISREYDRSELRSAQRWGARPRIALIRLEGAIAAGKSRPAPLGADGIAGAETLRQQIRRAVDDVAVRAIVLRVDSPGGDGLASDLIWRELVQARERKPLIVSMGDYAASGGYLVAVAADEIVAAPSTLTGSIGVFALKPDLSGLLAKLSVNDVSLQRGKNARILSFAKPWSAEERRLIERQIGAFYQLFVSRVAEGRHLSRDEVNRAAGGHVWTGAQAVELKLVDRIGTLEDAIALARTKAGYAPDDRDVEVRRYEPEIGILAGLLDETEARAAAPLRRLASALPELRAAALLSEMGPVLALPVSWVEPPPGG